MIYQSIFINLCFFIRFHEILLFAFEGDCQPDEPLMVRQANLPAINP
jgi:hypothetical protein